MSTEDSRETTRPTDGTSPESEEVKVSLTPQEIEELRVVKQRLSVLVRDLENILGTAQAKSRRPRPKATETGRDLAMHLMRKMYKRTETLGLKIPSALTPGSSAFKRRIESWGVEFDRVMRIDGLTDHDLRSVIDAAYKDQAIGATFCWAKVVCSPDKVRKHYIKLAELAKADGVKLAKAPTSHQKFRGYGK